MLVRITRGIYGYKPKGALTITPIHAGETCEVSAEKAEKLIGRGIAEAVQETLETDCVPAAEEIPEKEAGAAEARAGETVEDEADEEAGDEELDLSAMKAAELRELAEERGIPVTGLRTKSELIEAIRAASEPDLSVVGDVVE